MLFNLFFARQFSLISIELPVCLHYTIGKHLHTLNFPNKDSCNNSIVLQTPYQKQLGLLLDEKLNVGEHLRYVDNKVNTPIGLLCKIQNFLPRQTLFTIYKSFIRPHFDNEDVIFDQAYNSFMKTTSLFSEMLQ